MSVRQNPLAIPDKWRSKSWLTGCCAVLLPLFLSAQTFVATDGASISSCSGSFYDSGGPAGPYANNENITVVLCPAGGAASGPASSVNFTQWTIAAGAGDTLRIHNGPSTASPVLVAGTSGTSLIGQTYTSTDPSGCLTFHWTSNASGTAGGWTANIMTGPNAGVNASTSVCSNEAPFNMRTRLGGTPQTGGVWTAPGGGVHPSTFDPAVDVGGVWTYTVSGPAPCPDSVATLTINLVIAPNAGANGSLTLCSDDAPVALVNSLGAGVTPGGSWTGPGGAHSGTFNPASDPQGTYTYTVVGTPPCPDASATVNVLVHQRPNAGLANSTTICSNSAPFSLFGLLLGSPMPGGAWTGPGGAPVVGTYTPGTSTPGNYTYTVVGTPPCQPSSAVITVNQVTAPSAGSNRTITRCSTDAPFAMVGQLNGNPDPGGTWVGPGGPHGPNFNPATDTPGAYTYTVAGTSPCSNAQAVLTINVNTAPYAGVSASTTVCSTDGSFALFGVLTGGPNVGGTWTAPGGGAHPGTFIPGTSTPGAYTYTVVGPAPCAPATATVTVTVNTAPNAGISSSVSRCSVDPSFSLFSQLGGSPNAGGTWTGPSGPHGSTFTPGVDLPGAYTYTVAGLAPCANASAVVTVSVVTAPNAGNDGSTTVCSNSASFPLFGLLSGGPDATGTWTGPGNTASNGTFVPGTSSPGVYTYTVAGQAPCADDQSTVTVNVVQAPFPGTNGGITVCSNAASVNLFNLLGGGPDPGGTWTGPGGGAHSGTYLPASQLGGTYTYTVAGTTPCANASASVQVVRVIAPNAGVDGTTTVCSTNTSFNMITLLGGSPNGSGSWINSLNAPASATFTPGTTAPGTYRYIVPGTAPCANDTSQVSINVNTAPNAGANSAITVCSSDAPFNLIDSLNGSPDGGGTWTRPNGTAHSGVFTPGTSITGGYTYTVPGQTPCLNASAVVVVSVNPQPNAGVGGAFERCSTDAPVDLFTLLTGSAQTGGTWTGPSGPTNSVFFPATSPPGNYVYTVAGTAPCSNATATLVATVNQAPNAGSSGTITICTGEGVVDLFDGLGGTPDLNGTWNDDDNTGQQSGQFLDPTGLPSGDYDFTYTVPGIGQCTQVSATVRVTIVPVLDAGTSGTLTICGSNSLANLFSGLGGNPQPGGVWIDLSSTGALNGNLFNATLVAPGVYTFRYLLTGTLSCSSDSAQTTVTVIAPPNAGVNGSTSTCSNSSSFGLFQYLGGTPQGGGIWRRGSLNGPMFSGTYVPVTDDPGVFYYIVNGSAPCANAHATVTVTEITAPVAGISSSTTVCSNDPPFNMTALLGGSPQPGSWFFGGVAHNNIFVPGLDLQGIYEYRVLGQAPCANAVATLTITVEPAANAGTNSSRTVCSNEAQFLLVTVLGGNPAFNGSWIGPSGPHNGTYTPGSSEPGDYLYIVTGNGPCENDTAVVTIFENTVPDPGNSGTASLCAGSGSVNLITYLGGTPDLSGTWVGPAPGNPPFSGTFVPGTSSPGVYTYTVSGAFPCPGSVSSTVTVEVTQPANAGISNAITRCSNDPGFAMVDQLLGTPAFNGTWVGPAPGNAPSNGFFIPGTTAPGLYTYTVPGVGSCPSASSTLNISVNPRANAGNDANLTVCNTSGAQPLFPLLGANAQPGGAWTFQPTGTSHSGNFLPSVDQSGTYVYTVQGLPGCSSDFALVSVVVNQAPNAGFNNLITVCDDQDPFLLFNVLNGTPQSNGTWQAPGPVPHTGIFLPGSDPAGVYQYTVQGASPCVNATAQVTVIKNQAPDAGGNGVVSVCSSQPEFNLFDHLTGSPDQGGQWSDPSGSPFSGTYVPGTSTPGIYKYKIVGVAPCVSDSAQVTVVQNTAPDAGISTVVLLCSNDPVVALNALLGGTPDATGMWTFGGSPYASFFNPATGASGSYTYTVEGNAPCSDAEAQVQITVVPAPNAGSNGSIAACVDDPAVALFPGLNGTPETGGSWTDDDNTGNLSGSFFNSTGVAPGTYQFTYTVAGFGPPCASASATVSVVVTGALNAGEDTDIEVCASQASFLLFNSLNGSPQPGGAWQDLDGSGALLAGVFNPSVAGNGEWRFNYILTASAECQPDTAQLTVTVLEGPFAGCDGTTNQCSNFPELNLATALSCGPDEGGQWFTPSWVEHSGTFLPGTDAPGIYRYVVAAIGSCAADTATVQVQVTQAPVAGNDTVVSICSTDIPVPLFPLLGPNAEANGNWVYVTGGNVPHSGVYNPAQDSPGIYRYRKLGTSPCAADFAFVEVSEPIAANAGCNAVVSFCSDQVPVNMRLELGCSPQTGGTWVGPSGPHSNFFNPASDAPGVYTYTVAGVAPCADASATLTIGVTQAGDAGTSATVNACLSQSEVDLLAALGPLAQPGGIWTDVGGTGAVQGDLFIPAIAGNGTWLVQYAIPANGPCPEVGSEVTVVVGSGVSAGESNSLTVCGGFTAYPLISGLAGEPDGGGSWTEQASGMVVPNGLLDLSQLDVGSTLGYTYQVFDPVCGAVTSVLQITVSEFPDPGGGSEARLCETDGPLDLFAQLTGAPELDGTWTNPMGDVHSGTFIPGTDTAGPYAYTIEGNSACPDSSAIVVVIVDPTPNAGQNGEMLACDTVTALDLFTGLNGSPQAGGFWLDLDNSGGLTGGFLNTNIPAPGEYFFRYIVDVEACGRDSALVKVLIVDGVEVNNVVADCNTQDRTYTVSFVIEQGDAGSYSVVGLGGTLSSGSPYVFTSEPLFTSESYEAFISDQYACATIRIIGESPCDFESEVFVPQAFSPNGDGINDQFAIPGIEGYPGNTISIFNRWGGIMFEASGYDNRTVVWDGTSPDGTYAGSAPAGTYFYVIDLGNGVEPMSGYVYLNR